jgi:Mor family transcriptional regulator
MNNLPRSVRDIIDLVGLTPALALVRAYPGNIIKVPTGVVEDGKMRSRLIGIMGFDAAEKFIAHYGGERLTVPRCVDALRDERDQRIIAAYDGGQSVPALAVDNALTERQIRTILKRVPGETVNGLRPQAVDDKQLGLF